MDLQPQHHFTRSTPSLLLRGLTLRCPRCGQSGMFQRWTEMVDACPHCELVFEQEEGYWVGALTLNTVVSLLVGIGAVAAVTILTWPDIPVLLATVLGVVAMLVFPFVFYPISKTLWVAVDLAYLNPSRLEPGTGLRRTR